MVFQRTGFVRIIAASLAMVLGGFTATLAAPVGGTVSGTVILGVDKKPIVGATIHLSRTPNGHRVSSGLTGVDGNFQIKGVEAATYEVTVEHDGGLYLVGSPVRVEADQPLTLNLAIEKSAAVAKAAKAPRGAGALLASPLGATLLVVGTAITVGALVEAATSDDADPVASEYLTP